MNSLRWINRPELHEPVMIAAFEGWTDAGSAATGTAEYLAGRWDAEPFAEIDAEEFFDFTSVRPQVRLPEDRSRPREIVWPSNRFLAGSVPSSGPMGGQLDVIVLVGVEPHLKWRGFTGCVTEVATSLGVRSAFTVGSMLAGVPHTRPTPVRGSTGDRALASRFGLHPPQYQGPTGIVGVLQDAFAKAGIPAGSLMAQVPHYVPGMPSPKATIALIGRVAQLLGVEVATPDLSTAAAEYERQVDEALTSEEEIARYVHELEVRADELHASDFAEPGDLPTGDILAAQFEQFLREQDESP